MTVNGVSIEGNLVKTQEGVLEYRIEAVMG